MIIAISPSKTFQIQKQAPLSSSAPVFSHEAEQIRSMVRGWSKAEIQKRMKLSDALTEEVYDMYQKQDSESTTAITYYTGLVYKQLSKDGYNAEAWEYISAHVRILSAMYGILRPQDAVVPYRLDFLTKWPGKDLYGFWKTRLDGVLEKEIVVDLSSNEYGKLLPANRIRIQFLQKNKNGDWKSQSTKTKMARGRMLDWMIRNQIKTPDEIQVYSEDSYAYSSADSYERVWVFKQKPHGD